MRGMRSTTPQACMLVLLTVVAVSVFDGCKPENKTAAAPPPPPVVEVMPVIQRDEPIRGEWIGSLDGLVNAQIRAQVSGYLLKQNYTDGASVKKGDALFEIDPRTFQAALDRAKGNADKAKLDFDRTNSLAEENVVSKQDRDNAIQANTSALATLEEARLNLDFTKVRSPIDGVTGIAAAQLGDLVGPSSGVLTTVSTIDPIKVYFPITDQAYLGFRQREAGQKKFPEEVEYELITSDGKVYPHKGKFLAMDRQVDDTTGTIRLAASFPNPDLILRPGQTGRVRAVIREEKGALLVPQRAVSELQGTYQVAVIDNDNKAHVHDVKVGDRDGNLWIITDGLKPGDRVVVEGVMKAREGTTVNPQTSATAQAHSNDQPSVKK